MEKGITPMWLIYSRYYVSSSLFPPRKPNLSNAGWRKWVASVSTNSRIPNADIEQRLGHSVISSDKAIDHITPKDELPFIKEK